MAQNSSGMLTERETDELLKMYKLFEGILSPYNLYMVTFANYIIECGKTDNIESFTRLAKYVETIARFVFFKRRRALE